MVSFSTFFDCIPSRFGHGWEALSFPRTGSSLLSCTCFAHISELFIIWRDRAEYSLLRCRNQVNWNVHRKWVNANYFNTGLATVFQNQNGAVETRIVRWGGPLSKRSNLTNSLSGCCCVSSKNGLVKGVASLAASTMIKPTAAAASSATTDPFQKCVGRFERWALQRTWKQNISVSGIDMLCGCVAGRHVVSKVLPPHVMSASLSVSHTNSLFAPLMC